MFNGFLVLIQAFNPATAQLDDHWFCDGLPDFVKIDGIVPQRRLAPGLSFEHVLQVDGMLGGSGYSRRDALTLLNADQFLNDLMAKSLEGQKVEIYQPTVKTPTSIADFSLVSRGRVAGWTATRENIAITVSDRSEELKKALTVPVYDGLGGAGGSADLTDQRMPFCVGSVKAVKGVLIDPDNNVYQVHSRACQSIVPRINGAPQAATNVPDVWAWVPVLGQVVTDLASGLVRFGAPVTGKLCFDVEGDAVGGFVAKPGAVISRTVADFAEGFSAANLNAAALAQLDLDVPYDLGLWYEEAPTPGVVLEEVCASVGAMWWLDETEQLSAQQMGYGASSGTISETDVMQIETLIDYQPIERLRITHTAIGVLHEADEVVTATLAELDAAAAAAIVTAQSTADSGVSIATTTKTKLDDSPNLDVDYVIVPSSLDATTLTNGPAEGGADKTSTKTALDVSYVGGTLSSTVRDRAAAGQGASDDLDVTSYFNRATKKMTYSDGTDVDLLKPAAVGADVTAVNTALDVNYVSGTLSSTVRDRAAIANNLVTAGINDIVHTDSLPVGLDVDGGGQTIITKIKSTQSATSPRFDTSFYVLQSNYWYGHTSSDQMKIGESGNAVWVPGALQIDGGVEFNGGVYANSYLQANAQLFLGGYNYLIQGGELTTLRSTYNSTIGGFRFQNQVGDAQGYLYHDGGGFGLLSQYGGWAVKINGSTNGVDLLHNGSTKLQTSSSGVTVLGGVAATDESFFADAHPYSNAAYDLGTPSLKWRNGYFSGTVTATEVTATSGWKTKKNVFDMPANDGLDFARAARPVYYEPRDPAAREGRHVGFIAEWMAELDPSLAYRDGDGNWSLAYPKITAYNTAAIKGLDDRMEGFEAALAKLQRQNAQLFKMIEAAE